MIFRQSIRIEFNHCDPAGIVFYPRYFEMTNSVAENFFREVAGHSYAAMMQAGEGVPTAHLETTFHAPSRLEEVLDWRLAVTRLGNASIAFRMEAWCGDSHRHDRRADPGLRQCRGPAAALAAGHPRPHYRLHGEPR
jgi:4-hydroxybenzoyl-CoA thioesterase